LTKQAKVKIGTSSKANLTTGTKNTDSFSLSPENICRILSECHTAGVASLEIPGFSATFHPRRNEDAVKLSQASDLRQLSDEQVTSMKESRDQAELMDQNTLLEAEEAQLLIDDPKAFENIQMDKSIERARGMNEEAYTRGSQ
jgi:hypothetical protein